MQKSESLSDKVDALLLAHEVWGSVWFGLQAGRRHLVKLYESVDENLAQSEAIGRAALPLGNGYYCPELSAVLRKILRSHPQSSVRARAGLALVNVIGADRHAKRFIPEQIELLERLKSRFPDEGFGGVRLEDQARERLVRLRSLSVGATAQPLAGRDHLGSPIRLSDHVGEVVLLDFWSDGSPQCRSMYPQKRELVEQLKDRPFA
jgi:thiol-disulfide isomerase/thioredoxin